MSLVAQVTALASRVATEFKSVRSALSGKEPTIAPDATAPTSKYWRGDKTWQTLNKAAVGLGNVDNTTDLLKPLSTATTNALAGKEPTITAGAVGQYWRGDKTWQTLDKSTVGLDQVNNTSDANKPVSSAQQTALNAKEPTITPPQANQTTLFWRGDKTWAAMPAPATPPLSALPDIRFTNLTNGNLLRYDSVNAAWTNVVGNPALVGLGNVTNTAPADLPVSTATQAALDAKEPTNAAGTASQFYRGDKTWRPINGANLIQNPGFEDMRVDGSNNTQDPHTSVTGITFGPSGINRSGSYAAQLRANAAIAAGDVLTANGSPTAASQHPRCSIGETYRAEFWVRNGVTGTTNPNLRAFITVRDATGAALETAYSLASVTNASYQQLLVEFTVTNTAAVYITAGINAPSGMIVGDAFRVDDMALRLLPGFSASDQASVALRDYQVAAATVANLTSLAGAVTIDGYTVGLAGTSTPVLVKNQTTASQNGVYLANPGAWTRVSGFSADNMTALSAGHVRVQNGNANGGSMWMAAWNYGLNTVDTSPMNWYRVLTGHRVQSGTVLISPPASSAQINTVVNFPMPYYAPPNVVVSVNTGSPTVDYKVWVGLNTITTTQFQISLYRANTTTMNVTWMALPAD